MKDKRTAQQELAYELYKQGYKYADIATEVGCTLSAVKSWATRIWKNKKVANKSCNQNNEKVAKKLQPKKYGKGKHPNSRNGIGPPGNKNAEKHGFFSKILPDETFELVNEMEDLSPIEVIWQNIQLQHAAILRAQKIMYVKDQEDKTKELITTGENKIYQVQQSWDKQANFLAAQSRAMNSLNALIRQYEEMLKSDLATEEQTARITLLKVQVDKLNNKEQSDSLEKLDEIIKGIDGIANEPD